MKKITLIGVALLLLLLSGCAAMVQNPVAMSETMWQQKGTKIGVAMSVVPQADTHEIGAGCLLCLATVAAANSSLTAHIETLSDDNLPALKGKIADLLKAKGFAPVVLDNAVVVDKLAKFSSKVPNFAKKDFRGFKAKHGVDKLLVIEIQALGTFRTYASYVPTSDPVGTFRATGYMVNLDTNGLDWYQSFIVDKPVNGEWDEPKDFPGVTNAFYQALEAGKEQIISNFK